MTTQSQTRIPHVPVAGRVPPKGWYPTAEGSHRRYFDGVGWGPAYPVLAPAPFIPVTPVATPTPASDRPDPASDLPAYATVPPLVRRPDPYDETNGKWTPRTVLVPSRFAWPVALGAVWSLIILVVFDFLGPARTFDLSPWLVIVPVLFALALRDAATVRGRGVSLSRLWCLTPPPVYLAARTSAASTSWAIPMVSVAVTLAAVAVWYMPMDMLAPLADALGADIFKATPTTGEPA